VLALLCLGVSGDNYMSVNENTTAVMKCGIIFNQIKSNWLNPVGDDVVEEDWFEISENGSLLISNVRRTDAGQYKCNSKIKTDQGLTPKSVVVYLNVKCKYKFISSFYRFSSILI
jgi:hypothetical protein